MRVSELAVSRARLGAGDGANPDAALRLRAGAISLAVGSAIFAAKFVGYLLSGSDAILSDALESIVNVVAALFTLVSLAIASRPADSSHPYGHGKVEFLSSGFEGGLIAFAALVIVYEAVSALWIGHALLAIGQGMALVAVAGASNALLGLFLLRTGRATHSLALEADGLHVLADFWTSAGVIAGLLLVWGTGWVVLDPLIAIGVGANLAFTGARLLRRAASGLLDASDASLLARVARAINEARPHFSGIIAIHRLRAIRSGGVAHVDAHLVVPRFWTVAQAHDSANRFEDEIVRGIGQDARFIFHLDPCRAAYCGRCAVAPCPVRARELDGLSGWTIEELTGEPAP